MISVDIQIVAWASFPITAIRCGELRRQIRQQDIKHGEDRCGWPSWMEALCRARREDRCRFAECMRVRRTVREHYGKAWGRYGFVDAFNPLTNWYNPDVLGIDLGITMLMAENQRTGFVWKTFMKNKDAQRGMERAGFRSGNQEARTAQGSAIARSQRL